MARYRRLFPRRSRRSGGGEVVLVAIVLVGAALAAIGLYLVIAAAVGVIAWLIGKAVASTRGAAPAQPKLVVASAESASPAPMPAEQYHAVLPVDPGVFDDPVAAEAAALGVFEVWARQLPAAPKDCGGFVRSLELRTRVIGRLVSQCEGRRAVWRTAAYGGRERPGAPPIDVAQVDAWNPPPD